MFDEGIDLVNRVLQFNPDYIGFSIRNIDNTMPDNCVYYVDNQISRIILPVKKITSAKIILGGSGFSIFPQELMELTQADYGIVGEGETAFRQLLDSLDKGEDVCPFRNVLVRSATKEETEAHIHITFFCQAGFRKLTGKLILLLTGKEALIPFKPNGAVRMDAYTAPIPCWRERHSGPGNPWILLTRLNRHTAG